MSRTRRPLWRRILVPTLSAVVAGGVGVGVLMVAHGVGEPTAIPAPSSVNGTLTPSAATRGYPPLIDAARATWPRVEVLFLDASEQPTDDAASVDLIIVPLDASVARGDRQSFEAAEGYFEFTALPMADRGVIVWFLDGFYQRG